MNIGFSSGDNEHNQGPDPVGASQGEISSWGVNGNYSDVDRQQINRGTIGEGDIVVRDGEVPTDLNRDIDQAQELTKDDSTDVDLYVTDTGLDAVANAFTPDDPNTPENENTFGQWADQLGDYGRNTTRQFILLGDSAKILSDSENGFARLLGGVAQGINSTLDILGKFSLGIVPGVENHGGLATQIPALVFGDQLNSVLEVKLKIEIDPKTGKERTVIDGPIKYIGKDIDIENLPPDIQYAFVNGIQNSLEEAARNGAMQTGADKLLVAYNPEHGFLADIIESGWDTSLGAVFPSGNARQIAEMWEYFAENDISINGAAHSQGGLLTMRALQWLEDGALAKSDGEYRFQINGAPVSTEDFAAAVLNSTNSDDAFGDSDHNINPGDPIPLLLGGNATSAVQRLEAIRNIIQLFDSSISPHSSYEASGDFGAGQQPSLGEQ